MYNCKCGGHSVEQVKYAKTIEYPRIAYGHAICYTTDGLNILKALVARCEQEIYDDWIKDVFDAKADKNEEILAFLIENAAKIVSDWDIFKYRAASDLAADSWFDIQGELDLEHTMQEYQSNIENVLPTLESET